MYPSAKRVAKVVASLVGFALLGAYIAWNRGLNVAAGAAVGGAVGIFFGVVADDGSVGEK